MASLMEEKNLEEQSEENLTKEQSRKCPICNKLWKWEQHKEENEKKLSFACPTCKEKCDLKKMLMLHACMKCVKIFVMKEDLNKHILDEHQDEKKFTSKSDHMKKIGASIKIEKDANNVTDIKPFPMEELSFGGEFFKGEKRKFKCPDCDKSYTRQGMIAHAKMHLPKNFRFHCGLCSKTFQWEKDLLLHMPEEHTGITFRCECGLCFMTQYRLHRHASVCKSKTNAEKLILRRRITNQAGSKQYACSKQQSNVVVVEDECKRCGMKFVTNLGLLHHLKCNRSICSALMMKKHTERVLKLQDLSKKRKIVQSEDKTSHAKSRVPCNKMKNVELQDKTSKKTTDTVRAFLKCWVCGEDPPLKSSLMDHFKPQNMGMRYMCPKCDLHLESQDNLGDYFKTFHNLLKVVGERE